MMNSELMQRFQAAAETIRQRVGEAEIGVILGSGSAITSMPSRTQSTSTIRTSPDSPCPPHPVTPDAGGQAPSTGSACA